MRRSAPATSTGLGVAASTVRNRTFVTQSAREPREVTIDLQHGSTIRLSGNWLVVWHWVTSRVENVLLKYRPTRWQVNLYIHGSDRSDDPTCRQVLQKREHVPLAANGVHIELRRDSLDNLRHQPRLLQ